MKRLSLTRILLEIKLDQVLEKPSNKFIKRFIHGLNDAMPDEIETRVVYGAAIKALKTYPGFIPTFAELSSENFFISLKKEILGYDIPERYRGNAALFVLKHIFEGTSLYVAYLSEFAMELPRNMNIIEDEEHFIQLMTYGYKKYLRSFKTHPYILEANEMLSDIEAFYQYNKFAEIKDLNKISSMQELSTVSDDAFRLYEEDQKKETSIDKLKKKAKLEKVLDTPEYEVFIPHNKEGACFVGLQTKWCTAATSGDNMYDHYHSEDDPLFDFISKKEKMATSTGDLAPAKFQIHFGAKQFMDHEDRPVSAKKRNELVMTLVPLVNRFPVIEKGIEEENRKVKAIEDMEKIKIEYPQKMEELKVDLDMWHALTETISDSALRGKAMLHWGRINQRYKYIDVSFDLLANRYWNLDRLSNLYNEINQSLRSVATIISRESGRNYVEKQEDSIGMLVSQLRDLVVRYSQLAVFVKRGKNY